MIDSESKSKHEHEISLIDILCTLAEAWKLLVFGPLVVAVMAGVMSFLWPNTYESEAILDMREDAVVLFHSNSALRDLVVKYGYLERAGSYIEAYKNIKKDLVITYDKKANKIILLSKGSTPSAAQGLARDVIDAVISLKTLKGQQKEDIEREIEINNSIIDKKIHYLAKEAGQEKYELKIRNLHLEKMLRPIGEEVLIQEPTLPDGHVSPKRSLVMMLAGSASAFAFLLFIFFSNAWKTMALEADNLNKIARIRKAFSL